MKYGIVNNVTGATIMTSWYSAPIEAWLEAMRDQGADMENFDYCSDIPSNAEDLRELILGLPEVKTVPLYRFGQKKPFCHIIRSAGGYFTLAINGVYVEFKGCRVDTFDQSSLILTNRYGHDCAEILDTNEICAERRV